MCQATETLTCGFNVPLAHGISSKRTARAAVSCWLSRVPADGEKPPPSCGMMTSLQKPIIMAWHLGHLASMASRL